MAAMNEQVRQMVKVVLHERGMTQTQLAELTGIERPNITRLLSGSVGKTPDNWQKILDALGLEMVVQPRPSPESQEEAKQGR